MYGDIYPMKIWEKQLICLASQNYAIKLTILSQNLCCRQSKQYRVIDASFRLYGGFWAEKYSMVFLQNPWNVLTRMRRKKRKKEENDTFCTLGIEIAACVKLLNIKYEFYGFSDDLIGAIN